MKYTKKQIQEAIAHWEQVLESMNEAEYKFHDPEDLVTIRDMLKISALPRNREFGMLSPILIVCDGKVHDAMEVDFVRDPNIPDPGTLLLSDGTPASKAAVEQFKKDGSIAEEPKQEAGEEEEAAE